MSDEERILKALAEAEDASGEASDATVRRLRWILASLTEFAPGRRGVCPPREVLVAHFDRALAASETATVQGHVDSCPFCQADLADLKALAAPPLFELAVSVGAEGLRLLSHTFSVAASPAPAAARGPAGAALELGAQSDDLAITVKLHPASAGNVDVRVMLCRDDRPIERARVNLLCDDALLESRVSARGEVIFADVSPGEYTLTVAPTAGDEAARVSLCLTVTAGAGG